MKRLGIFAVGALVFGNFLGGFGESQLAFAASSEIAGIEMAIVLTRGQNNLWFTNEFVAVGQIADKCLGPMGGTFGHPKVRLDGVMPMGSSSDLSPEPIQVSPHALFHGPIGEVLPILPLTREERDQLDDLLENPTGEESEMIRRAISLQTLRVNVADRMYGAAIRDHQSKDTGLDRYVWGPVERCDAFYLQLSQAHEMQKVGDRLIGMYTLLKMSLAKK